jgi:hypothetical protein
MISIPAFVRDYRVEGYVGGSVAHVARRAGLITRKEYQ